ncbi:unnamed protein product [Urochloa humidicola]
MKSSSQSQSPKAPLPRGGTAAGDGAEHARSASEPWVVSAATAASAAGDDSCVNDVDNIARTVAAVKSKSAASCARPDMVASVLSHYAANWLPDVALPSASSPAT